MLLLQLAPTGLSAWKYVRALCHLCLLFAHAHRSVSGMRSSDGRVYALTYRIGRHIPGLADIFLDLLRGGWMWEVLGGGRAALCYT